MELYWGKEGYITFDGDLRCQDSLMNLEWMLNDVGVKTCKVVINTFRCIFEITILNGRPWTAVLHWKIPFGEVAYLTHNKAYYLGGI